MKNEDKVIVSTIIAIGGAILGYCIGDTEEQKRKYAFNGFLLGGAVGLGVCFWEEKNTINYTLKHKNEKVYDGICNHNRFERRLTEHRLDGKRFDKAIRGPLKTRSEAMRIEKIRIKKNLPKYNVQHAC